MERGGPTGFVGLSHLGLVTSVAWASCGRPVLAYDPNGDLVGALQKGHLTIHEPGLPELLERARSSMQFIARPEELSACPLVIVSLDVPTAADNSSDLIPVLALIDSVLPMLRQHVVLVIMSQVPPGFTRRVLQRIRDARPDLNFTLYYLVETLIFGRAVERALKPERFIVGAMDPRLPLDEELAHPLRSYGCPVLAMRYESAELAKTAINLYLIGSVTYANTLADLCEALEADWSEIVPALRLDQRIGPAAYLRPGLGIAGGNLERDLQTLKGLAYERGVDVEYLKGLEVANERRYRWLLRMLRQQVFPRNPVPRIAIWGLTYKKNTRSVKNSTTLRFLNDFGTRVDCRVWDPVICPGEMELPGLIGTSPEAVLEGADALLILTDWEEFLKYDLQPLTTLMRTPCVLDCVGVFEGRRHELGGIQYVSMGRPIERVEV